MGWIFSPEKSRRQNSEKFRIPELFFKYLKNNWYRLPEFVMIEMGFEFPGIGIFFVGLNFPRKGHLCPYFLGKLWVDVTLYVYYIIQYIAYKCTVNIVLNGSYIIFLHFRPDNWNWSKTGGQWRRHHIRVNARSIFLAKILACFLKRARQFSGKLHNILYWDLYENFKSILQDSGSVMFSLSERPNFPTGSSY